MFNLILPGDYWNSDKAAAFLLQKRKDAMLARRNHVFEQLGRTFRERSVDVVAAALPADMLSLVLELANVKPGSPPASSDQCKPRKSATTP